MTEVIQASNQIPVDASVSTYRRLITGEDQNGAAVFVADEICRNTIAIRGIPTFASTELWRTTETPARLDGPGGDPAAGPPSVAPPAGGTALRIVEFPPDNVWGGASAQAMMHRTASIDYAYVIEGEIFAVLDNEEQLMRAGDVLIQRGTNHAWSNRSDASARVLFVLIDAVLPERAPLL